MEKLDVFDYIDRACGVLDDNISGFTRATDRLTEYLQTTFGEFDVTVGVTSRIKNRDSFKEKILRNSLYKDYPADRLAYEMHDIIGVRLECRFFKDEQYLYEKIREIFCVDADDGYFSPVGKKNVKLKLDTPQPERQKNGFDIYRIDGIMVYAGESYNFELQIKSLVNSFWSEIEHKLIYKNFKVNPFDTLMKELLNSIRESLLGIDHQLTLIFERVTSNRVESQLVQLENMLTLGLNEMYTAIIKAHTGISVSLSEYSEAIVVYLLNASSYLKDARSGSFRSIAANSIIARAVAAFDSMDDDDDEDGDDNNYGGLIISLMSWLRSVDYDAIAIGDMIDVKFSGGEPAENLVAEAFEKNINADFFLNTFFHIFFSIERGTDAEDFDDYIRYYTARIMRNKTQEQTYRTLAALSELPAQKLPLEDTVKMLEEIR